MNKSNPKLFPNELLQSTQPHLKPKIQTQPKVQPREEVQPKVQRREEEQPKVQQREVIQVQPREKIQNNPTTNSFNLGKLQSKINTISRYSLLFIFIVNYLVLKEELKVLVNIQMIFIKVN